MKKDILYPFIFFVALFSCNKKKHFDLPVPGSLYQSSFFSERILYKANRFAQSQTMGSFTVKKCTLIINQILEEDFPIDTSIFERNKSFPLALHFFNEVLSNEIPNSNSTLLQGSVLIRTKFYYKSKWAGELEFQYPIFLLNIYRK